MKTTLALHHICLSPWSKRMDIIFSLLKLRLNNETSCLTASSLEMLHRCGCNCLFSLASRCFPANEVTLSCKPKGEVLPNLQGSKR
uniref:Uncharacterized protein n=1 Tax=Arundo donax TaxID=35708 RepID=A0A0A9F5V7_ARUDO